MTTSDRELASVAVPSTTYRRRLVAAAEVVAFVALDLWMTLSLGEWWNVELANQDDTGTTYVSTLNVVPLTAVLVLFAWVSLRLRELRWRDVGLRSVAGLGRRAGLFTVVALVIAVVGTSIGEFSSYGPLLGNETLLGYYLYISVWAGFGEEMVYRGYLLHRLADIVGDSRVGWIVAGVGSALLFSIGHLYLGVAGALSSLAGALLAALLFLNVFRRNLWPLVAVHVVADVAMFALIYVGVLT
ncbi:MAG: CPBP family glutamic-type intramembrane protease [Phycicoccus sp.]